MQITVENCTIIGINALQKSIRKLIDRDYKDSTVDEIYELTMKELRQFTVNSQTFNYTAIDNHLGGHRWFFLCPKCGERASKLFLPPEGRPDREHLYLCKGCHKLKNQSALMGQNNMYRKVTRPLRKMKLIEEKINKGHLKANKIQELLDEYEVLEKQLKSAPEYRLYAFKKTRGLI